MEIPPVVGASILSRFSSIAGSLLTRAEICGRTEIEHVPGSPVPALRLLAVDKAEIESEATGDGGLEADLRYPFALRRGACCLGRDSGLGGAGAGIRRVPGGIDWPRGVGIDPNAGDAPLPTLSVACAAAVSENATARLPSGLRE